MLGPVEVRDEAGRLLEVSGARLRALLVLLALRPGQLVPAGYLIDELWESRPPDGAPPSPRPGLAEPLLSDSLSLRTTGASIVEDAERTNSPISSSLVMTTLLSTPNSFASS